MAKRKRAKSTPDGRTTIAGHSQKGSKLTPPFAALPNLQLQSWREERLPEMLWAALIVSYFEQPVALRLMERGINYLAEKRVEQENESGESRASIACDVTHTGLSQMDAKDLQEFLSRLTPDEECRTALRPLLCLDSLPAREAWFEAVGMEPTIDDWSELMKAVGVTLDHQSQEATDCRFARVMAAIAGGRYVPSRQTFDEFLNYPDVDLRKVRPAIRASELVMGAIFDDSSNHEWPAQFWEQCLHDSPCWTLNTQTETYSIGLVGTTPARIREVRKHLIDHCNQTRSSTMVDARHDTVFGVGLYGLNVLEDLLRIGIGNTALARMGLRSLVESLITLSYLAQRDDPQLWRSYRVFGSGQAKLQALKLVSEEARPSYVDVETLQNLANEDTWEEFLPIELGHWEKSNARKMSDEGGVKVFYDRYYAWTSTFSHGHWGAIRDTVFDTCGNPLHRLHRIPRDSPRLLPDVVPDAAICMDKILEVIAHCYPDFSHRVSI